MVKGIDGGQSATMSSAVRQTQAQTKSQEKAAVEETGSVSRVEELKARITSGEYTVDLKATAQKIAESLL